MASEQLSCEGCRRIDGLAWRSGSAGRRLLCRPCGDEWEASQTKPSIYDADSDEEMLQPNNRTRAGSKDSLDSLDSLEKLERKVGISRGNGKINIRPFFPPQPLFTEVERPIPREKPFPLERHFVMRVQTSQDPLVELLNSFNPGLGVTAAALRRVGIKEIPDLQRMRLQWWPVFFKFYVANRGLKPFDEIMLRDGVAKYLEQEESGANLARWPPYKR